VKKGRPIRTQRREAGIALLISIFILLLISVVAIALIVSSGTESALAGNYRSSTAVYYAALSGLEEARSRLLTKNPSSFKNTSPGFLPSPGVTMAIGSVAYVLNPSPDPSFNENLGNLLTVYPDAQYDIEFGPGALAAANGAGSVHMTPSVWNTGPLNAVNGTMAGPLYKWVRINAVSEKSLNIDVDADSVADSITPLYYDGAHFSNNSAAGPQVLEITSFAVLPNGSQKFLQYLAAPAPLNLSFQAALTLDGNNVQLTAPNSSNFYVSGIDSSGVGSCYPGSSAVAAVGYTNNSDSSQSNIVNAISSGPPPLGNPDLRHNYTDGNPPYPSVRYITLSPNLQTVAGLNNLVQTIVQNADSVISGPVTQSDSNNVMPSGMDISNPKILVVNGDFTINHWTSTGYGLLLVTGKFTFDPDAAWDGIVLVIGKGWVYSYQAGSGQFEGAMFLAKTVDASNNPLPPASPLGSPYFQFTSSSGSNGIYYSSCWIQAAMPTLNYKILSFHEISQ
jgi:hypothetical protein